MEAGQGNLIEEKSPKSRQKNQRHPLPLFGVPPEEVNGHHIYADDVVQTHVGHVLSLQSP